jgi:hypothetical protein
MPELKRTFSKGVMNKDLDERLLPNGQYRDALNVQVSTSEGADVGSLQNVLGNKLPYTNAIGTANLGNYAYVVGAIRRDETECIYWLVGSDEKSLVIEYNQLSNTVTPVLVDQNRILNFDRDNLITGIEILDDFLIWTDNKTEPKMIKVSDWKGYTNELWTHTQVDGGDFEEKHCTVIKEGPRAAPKLKMAKTTREGPISATLRDKSFTYIDSDTGRWDTLPTGEYLDQNGDGTNDSALNRPLANPADSEIIFSGTAPDFRQGDKIKITLLKTDEEDVDDETYVVASIIETYKAYPKIFKINIDSISNNIEQNIQNWRVELIQKPALFETKFVRFAYRYKYKDGEYSTISPFSTVAFLGDEFDYDHRKGYNLGMVNQLRKLEVRNWAPASITGIYEPYNVEEIDILYKDSVSNNIYIVKSIKTTDSEYNDVGNFLDPYSGRLEITSELIYKVIPSNQILRPYDNVPRKAKALAVSGNRLMFGNYVENYNVKSQGKEISVRFAVTVTSAKYDTFNAIESIKSQRTYQIGVVYRDKYGRETPVLTDTTGSVKLNKGFASSRNSIRVRITSPMPDWVDSYKYYIRETSQPYYNIAMDRHYPAEDGNVWIAFSSSDRNKIQEETFLEIKKRHDSNVFVEEEAKYKVLAVENEAPDFIKQENVSKGVISREIVSGRTGTGTIFGSVVGYPLATNKFIDILADDWQKVFGGSGNELTSATPVHQLNNLNLIMFNDENSTKRYEITTIQYFAHYSPAIYRINLKTAFDSEDIQFVKTFGAENASPSLSIEVFQTEIKQKPEYQGRFFAKLQRDSILENSIIIEDNSEANLKVVASQPVFTMGDGNKKDSKYWYELTKKKEPNNTTPGWFIDQHAYFHVEKTFGPLKFGNVSDSRRDNFRRWGAVVGRNYMDISWHNVGNEVKKLDEAMLEMEKFAKSSFTDKRYFPNQKTMYEKLTTVGTRFWFAEDPKKEENIYTIKSYAVSYVIPYESNNKLWKNGRQPNNRVINIGIILDKKIKWSPEDEDFSYNGQGVKPNKARIEVVETFYDEKEGDFTDNPAIFETEPKEVAELDIYYEASNAYEKSAHGSTQRLFYSNCFSFGNGVESDRIRDDFNAPTLGKGVKVSTVLEDQYKEVNKKSDIIFSGIYNSTSGTNNLNQFIQAEQITKSINPSYGSIQLMQFRLGDLDVYLEDNVVKVLADRDALFNADGSKNVVASTNVLGSIQPYAGDYGISKNPESYARYGNRAYFSDKNRGVILRLSGNGLTPISKYGMDDYFRDKLAKVEKVVGSYDENKDEYNLTLTVKNNHPTISAKDYNDTAAFKEDVNGWNSRKSFIQENGLSLNNIYYTFKDGELWSHDNETRNNFYGTQYESSVKFIFNDAPGSVKSFKTINYEGSQARVFVDDPDTDNKFRNRLAKAGWWVSSIESDLQSGQVKTFKNKEGKWFYNILGTETTLANLDTKEYSVQGLGYISAITGSQGQDIEIRLE